jgi:hypothetical protein
VGQVSEHDDEPREDFGASRDEEVPEGVDPETGEITEQTPREAAEADGSEEQIKKAERAVAAFNKRIDVIFGDNAPKLQCPRCEGLGRLWEDAAAEVTLVQADDAEPCAKCDAKGQTATGSKVPGQESKPCGRCGGRGWHEKRYEQATVTPLPQTVDALRVATGQDVMGWQKPDGTFVPLGTPNAVGG